VKEYEITEETYVRPNGERYIIQQILEKGSCRIVGRRTIELGESDTAKAQMRELLRRAHPQ